MLREKGFVPVLILIVVALIGVVGGVTYIKMRRSVSSEVTPPPSLTEVTPSAQPSAGNENPTSTPTLSTKSPTPTSTPKPTSTPTPKKNTCGVNVIYGKLGGGASDPLLVTLVYSFTGQNNIYMTGAQWDFDGNGSWDTDLKQSNGTMEHTYGGAGTYKVRLQLQGSDGSMTDICTKNVTISPGVAVTLSGKVYNDANCNNVLEPWENGIASVQVTMTKKPEYSIYKTLTTDSNGNYSFTEYLRPDQFLELNPSPVLPSGYSLYYSSNNFYALGSSQPSINRDISLVPDEKVPSCSN